MNRTAIERFSIDARRKLIQSVESAMIELGVGPKSKSISVESAGDVTVITLEGGLQNTISSDEAKWRDQLIEVIGSVGYENVLEQVAYTWFNRLIAIRYMEVNDFLPTHVRVLSSLDPEKDEPDIVTQFAYVPLQIPQSEREEILRLKDENLLDQMFSRIFIHQCRELNRILPELFTLTKPYENLLLRLSYVNQDGVLRDLVDNVPEEDFRDAVQIIGWMYQYYNTEQNNLVYDGSLSKSKLPKELVPAATTIYTPDWVVKYMVDNSLGRLWFEEGLCKLPEESSRYLKHKDKLIIRGHIRNPEEITFFDPCMGSGHILVYAFDFFMDIYRNCGYVERDAAELIVRNNLFGMDLNDRAYQLAYFAIMMRGRQYDSNFLNKGIMPNVAPIVESNDISSVFIDYISSKLPDESIIPFKQMCTTFIDAKEYGSLLKGIQIDDYESILKGISPATTLDYNFKLELEKLISLCRCSNILGRKYDVVVTNPPYLGSSRFNERLSDYSKKNFPITKSDLSMMMYEVVLKNFIKKDGYVAFITTNSWMFLSSFESLRLKIIDDYDLVDILDLGSELFEGKVGHNLIVSWITRNSKDNSSFTATKLDIFCYSNKDKKEPEYFNPDNEYVMDSQSLKKVPGSPVAYWLSDNMISCFEKGTPLKEIASPRQGLATGENARFVRQWYEVDVNNIKFNCKSRSDSVESGVKWFPYNKGGEARRWYGNNDYIIDWENDGDRLRNFKDSTGKLRSVLRNPDYYFQPSITWSLTGSYFAGIRLKDYGHIHDVNGMSIFCSDDVRYYISGFMNSKVASEFLSSFNPTISNQIGDISKLPLIFDDCKKDLLRDLVLKCVDLAKDDWDDYECSWDFISDPIIRNDVDGILESAIVRYKQHCIHSFETTKSNEEKINSIFIEIYGLSDELTNIVDNDRITIRIPTDEGCVKNLISYAIGCMFGRYSLDQSGLVYAGGVFEPIDSRFRPDLDNIIPINDNEYFGDDVVTLFVEFIEVAFGKETLEENLKYIANNLGVKGSGTSRERIRKYFLTDFYKDHLKMYSNLPIYWLFDSGKENGFKALIYMHRYNENLIPKMRQDYLLPMQRRYQDQFDSETDPTVRSKLEKKLNEIQTYDIAMELYSTNKVTIDLDDGVKVNHAKFQNIEIPGEKNKINLLYKLK